MNFEQNDTDMYSIVLGQIYLVCMKHGRKVDLLAKERGVRKKHIEKRE